MEKYRATNQIFTPYQKKSFKGTSLNEKLAEKSVLYARAILKETNTSFIIDFYLDK